MEAATKAQERISEAQIREAETRLVKLLCSKNFPRDWIERHAPEAMAQARSDFAARLAKGHEDDTVGLLVIIAYRRALKVLRGDHCGPPTTSLETAFHLADDSAPTPEEEAIDRDREEQVLRAMSYLPERERKLLALVYFEGLSIRQAGLRVGWKKSVANRHHRAALERLEAFLDRSLLAPEIAIPAYLAVYGDSVSRAALLWMEGALETVRETAILASGRVGPPLVETSTAAATSGAGRGVAGVCGAAVLACLAGAATGVVGAGVEAMGLNGESSANEARQGSQAPQATSRAGMLRLPPAGAKEVRLLGENRPTRKRSIRSTAPSIASRPSSGPREEEATATQAPSTPGKQTVREFGMEGSGVEGSAPSGAEPVTEATPISPNPPAAARPATGAQDGGSSSSGNGSPSASGASPEFGM